MIANETFLEAVKQGVLDKVRAMLDEQPELVNAKDEKGISAALWASYRGHKEIAAFLVSKGANLNIFEAATVGSADLVQKYVKNDPSLALAFAPDGFTALGLASFFGNADVVSLLIKAGADPNTVSKNSMRVTPLHSAVANRDGAKALELTKMLLANNAKVNVAQEGGWTPLHQAAAHGQIEVLKALLQHGADINAKSTDGQLPVDMAIQGGHQEAAALLQQAATKSA